MQVVGSVSAGKVSVGVPFSVLVPASVPPVMMSPK